MKLHVLDGEWTGRLILLLLARPIEAYRPIRYVPIFLRRR